MIKFFLLFFICTISVPAQSTSELWLKVGNETKAIPAYSRQGMVYVPVRPLAEALSWNYFYNSSAEKFELKFSGYNLKFTAKNPFLVLTSKVELGEEVIQLPTSTYVIKNEIFIPLEYCLSVLGRASGIKLHYNKNENQLTAPQEINEINNIPPETGKPVEEAFNIYDLSIDEKVNGTLVKVYSNRKIPDFRSSIKDGILSLNMKGATVNAEKINSVQGKGLIKKLHAKNINRDAEINFTLGKDYTTGEVISEPDGYNLLITIHNKAFVKKGSDKAKEKWSFDVVVIDAGHGGKDHGTIGVKGIKEKDINLAVALKLGQLIEKGMKNVKVVYTRKKDNFVELYKRGKIANENNGKLFISIHCNSTANKSQDANGFEVYLLRPGRTKEAIAIAERENSVIQYEENPERYQQLTDENFILVTMAHSSYMKYSEKFSEFLNKQFSGNSAISSRGVKQAGFYVLVGASMPSALLELGFLSNPADAKYLNSSGGQQKIAESVFESIKKFKEHYEKIMEYEL